MKHQLSSAETTTSQPLPRSIKPSFFSSSNLRPPSRSKEPFTAPPHMNNKLLIEEADRERNQYVFGYKNLFHNFIKYLREMGDKGCLKSSIEQNWLAYEDNNVLVLSSQTQSSTIRDKIIPHVVSWFTYEAVQEDEFKGIGDGDNDEIEDDYFLEPNVDWAGDLQQCVQSQ
ncbi:hypothetical protein E3N88_18726 [Mikania micrantha]|uniref:Uncharacterized protein n=1 Tax=Mikania micrantha TaxID=192012 RepID=A0A5N6NMX6_9ASTR|nr:hypothetical protein E3N88_18726 [Mikania micrantha]